MFRRIFILLILSASSLNANAQINQDKLGAWYMYFFATAFKDTEWGFQGDVQLRNWNLAGDLEQLLIRGGLTYKPKDANIKFTLCFF